MGTTGPATSLLQHYSEKGLRIARLEDIDGRKRKGFSHFVVEPGTHLILDLTGPSMAGRTQSQ